MEYGLIPQINQYADNNKILVDKIQPSNEISEIKEGDEAQELSREKLLKSKEVSKSKEVTLQEVEQYKEVVLTNLNFGYNSSSKDFFVRVVRGDVENQFPTDEMMKLKAYFIAKAKAEIANNN